VAVEEAVIASSVIVLKVLGMGESESGTDEKYG